jgi:hypothetical protein
LTVRELLTPEGVHDKYLEVILVGNNLERDSDRITKLTKYVLLITKFCEMNPVEYPSAIRAYNTVLYGVIPQIKVKCHHESDGVCEIALGQPCGGLFDAMEHLDEAMEELELEEELALPSAPEPYQNDRPEFEI